MKEIRVALVAGGFIARAHAAAWKLLPLYFPELPPLRLRLLCEADEALARAAAGRLGFEQWAVGWEEAVARDDVDLVAIATPPDLHHDVAIAAARAGRHVFCEKPLALTGAEAKEMLLAVEAADVVHAVGFNFRQAPALRQAARMIAQGELGEVFHVSGRYFQDHGRDPGRPASWRYRAARAGSGAVGDIGSHLLDVAGWLVGEMTGIASLCRTVFETRGGDAASAVDVDVDDYAAFLARFAAGATGVFEVSRVAGGRRNQLSIEIHGSEGSIAFDWERSNELDYFSPKDALDRQGFRTIRVGPEHPGFLSPIPVAGIGIGFVETLVAQAANLVRRIAGDPTAHLATFREGWRNCRLTDAVLESSRRGAWVEIALSPQPDETPGVGAGAGAQR